MIYGGTLVVTNLGASPFAAGDSFKLFSAAGYAGSFTNIQPVIPGINLAWNTNTLTNGILSVVAQPTPAPVIGPVQLNGTGVVFTGSNGVRGWTFYVLTSTNLATPLAGWKRVFTNSFAADGSFNFTNPVTPAWADSFFMLLLSD